MKNDAADILEEALKLPPEARAAIAGTLIDSPDEKLDEGAEAEWETEIAKRLMQIDSGKVKTVPWAEARRRISGK
jgi:putative addiction module component (TIGR02574 family)